MNERIGFTVDVGLVDDLLLALYAEDVLFRSHAVQGVWWHDELDVAAYSAPRGVIHKTALPAWTATAAIEMTFNSNPVKTMKLVDASGKPLLMYHGTHATFSEFDMSKSKDGAHFFVGDESHACSFGPASAYHLHINNPLEISQEDLETEWDKEHPDGEQDDRNLLPRDFVGVFVRRAKAEGRDAVIIRRMGDRDIQADMYLPLNADQIKSAGNHNKSFNAAQEPFAAPNARRARTDNGPSP